MVMVSLSVSKAIFERSKVFSNSTSFYTLSLSCSSSPMRGLFLSAFLSFSFFPYRFLSSVDLNWFLSDFKSFCGNCSTFSLQLRIVSCSLSEIYIFKHSMLCSVTKIFVFNRVRISTQLTSLFRVNALSNDFVFGSIAISDINGLVSLSKSVTRGCYIS